MPNKKGALARFEELYAKAASAKPAKDAESQPTAEAVEERDRAATCVKNASFLDGALTLEAER